MKTIKKFIPKITKKDILSKTFAFVKLDVENKCMIVTDQVYLYMKNVEGIKEDKIVSKKAFDSHKTVKGLESAQDHTETRSFPKYIDGLKRFKDYENSLHFNCRIEKKELNRLARQSKVLNISDSHNPVEISISLEKGLMFSVNTYLGKYEGYAKNAPVSHGNVGDSFFISSKYLLLINKMESTELIISKTAKNGVVLIHNADYSENLFISPCKGPK